MTWQEYSNVDESSSLSPDAQVFWLSCNRRVHSGASAFSSVRWLLAKATKCTHSYSDDNRPTGKHCVTPQFFLSSVFLVPRVDAKNDSTARVVGVKGGVLLFYRTVPGDAMLRGEFGVSFHSLSLSAFAAVYCRAAKFEPYITVRHIMTNSKLTEGAVGRGAGNGDLCRTSNLHCIKVRTTLSPHRITHVAGNIKGLCLQILKTERADRRPSFGSSGRLQCCQMLHFPAIPTRPSCLTR